MRLVLITGASSGIGRQLALQLADKGYSLILVGRHLPALQEVAALIGTRVEVEIFQADLAQDRSKLLALMDARLPDYVVNNAGFGLYGQVISVPFEELQEMVDVNCMAVMEISQHAINLFKHHKKPGVILNISSALGFFPCPFSAVYAASKAFVTSFSQAVDEEVRPLGIRVLTACPGQVATAFRSRASKGYASTAKSSRLVLDPKQVASLLIKQMESKHALQIIDWKYRFLLFSTKLIPGRWVRQFLASTLRKLHVQ